MARSGVNRSDVQAARLALVARGENPSIDAVRIELGNTGSKSTIHRLMRELDATEDNTTAPQIDAELTRLVARLADRLREQAQERFDEAQARLDVEKKEIQDTLNGVERRLADLIERHARQTTKLGTQTATLLSTQEALQVEQKNKQIRSLKEQHLQSHTQCALLQERLHNAQTETEKLQARLTERDQQNRVLELILIKTEVALENLRAGRPDTDTR